MAGGCSQGGDDEEVTSTEQNKVAFEGKADPALAGTYKTQDGRMTYTLGKEGDFHLKGKVATQGGMMDQNVDGSWAVNGDKMLFKYNDSVVPYLMKKDGNKLKLSLTGKMKRETVLVKQ
ncbi:hypothetical protein EON82_15195 [bacterium]|nr:MAG: hypothetical protein EON82_15195 [bacterium]